MPVCPLPSTMARETESEGGPMSEAHSEGVKKFIGARKPDFGV